uniref:Uncharacterized protein n=1 Tax=Panagrolaimus sp. ES5 TaxID=591445 RepID=A0AC34FSK0_9BILA
MGDTAIPMTYNLFFTGNPEIDTQCLFRKDNGQFLRVMLYDTEFTYDEIQEVSPGAIVEFDDIGVLEFVAFGTEKQIADRITREELALQQAGVEVEILHEISSAFSEMVSEPSLEVIGPVNSHVINNSPATPQNITALEEVVTNIQQEIIGIKKSVSSLKRRRSSRRINRDIIEAAVVELDGVETNLSNLSRAELDRLLAVNRQKLGAFPIVADITPNKLISTLEPIIMKAFRECKFSLFVAILASYLLTRTSMVKSFMPPMGIQLRKYAHKSNKLKLNPLFIDVFKYYALFFG